MKIRKPAVAGSFYPAYKEELSSVIREMALQQSPLAIKDMGTITGGIIPHAGYIYSGRIALPFFRLLTTTGQKFETIIILHPNHYGAGPQIALDTHEAWETPFGITALDLEISSALGLKISADAHRFEHSAEVMLPFLQFFLTHPFKIVPIALSRLNYLSCRMLAEKLSKVTVNKNNNTLIIASSDFSHFVSPETGTELDDKAVKHIYELDAAGFYDTVTRHDISICGYAPIMTLIEYCKISNERTQIGLLARGHSGLVNLEDSVVHYLSMLFYEPKKQ